VIIQLQLIDELFGMDCMHPAEVLRQLPAEGGYELLIVASPGAGLSKA
jgi:hypothetical protein